MKILSINYSDLEGGAAKAGFRILMGLRDEGVDAKMLVQQKKSDHHFVSGPSTNISKAFSRLRIPMDNLPKLFYPGRTDSIFHIQWLPDLLAQKVKEYDPDILHLHWTCRGFMSARTLSKFNKPVVWTLHDMWPFTGGCHYSGECDRYKKQCGQCPQLGSTQKKDLSFHLQHWKAKHLEKLNLKIIAPSNWIGHCARESRIFRNFEIQVIPNGLNLDAFRPYEKKSARDLFGLSEDSYLLLFGAASSTSDRRKGFHYLFDSINQLKISQIDRPVELVIFGASKPAEPPLFKFKTHYIGNLYDDVSIALLYSACDVFVAPSLEDNLPNTVMESMACGTPCVAFDVGGISDMIGHKDNGYLARPNIADDLAQGTNWVIQDQHRLKKLSSNANMEIQKKFEISQIAKRYLNVYGQF